MKKSVYITGISCAFLMLVGCIFKIMHWPGANPMILASVLLFCFWFLPSGLMSSYSALPLKKMKALHIITYIVFSVCMMGVLFKVMHWPGAAIFLLLGVLLPFVVFLPAYLYHTREEEKAGNKNFFGLIVGLIFLAVFGVLLALSVSKQVLWQAVESVKYNESSQKIYKTSSKENAVSISANEICAYADELKCMILTNAGETMCDGNKFNTNYNPEEIGGMDNRGAVAAVFSPEEGISRATILKEKINSFRDLILKDKSTSSELAELTKTLFDTSDNDVNGIYPLGLPWEQREFNNYSVIFMLDFLSKLQSNVRLVEGEALN